MNSTTLAKIEAATPFLLQFRSDVPNQVQTLIAPYLDQPYQLALKILDCCMGGNSMSIDEIARQTGVSKGTVLTVFQQSGIQFQSQPKRWQTLRKTEPQA